MMFGRIFHDYSTEHRLWTSHAQIDGWDFVGCLAVVLLETVWADRNSSP